MANRDPSEIKRLNIEIPKTLYDRFIKLLPYRGELTGFIRRCMQAAILEDAPHDAVDKADDIVSKLRERREL